MRSCEYSVRVFIAVLLLMSAPACLFAVDHSIRFVREEIKRGSYAIDVRAVVQDDVGYLWFATRNGIYKYDGHSSKAFKYLADNQQTISHNSIIRLIKDQTGLIWILSETGTIDSINPLREEISRYSLEPHPQLGETVELIESVFVDSNEGVWALSIMGSLLKLDSPGNHFTRFSGIFDGENEIEQFRINLILEDEQNRLVISVENVGLFVYDPEKNRFESDAEITVPFLIEMGWTEIWRATNWQQRMWFKALGRGDREKIPRDSMMETIERVTSAINLESHQVARVKNDNEHQIWIGTSGAGLYIYDTETKELSRCSHSPSELQSLSSEYINDIHQDDSETIWIATKQGLNRYSKYKFKFNITPNVTNSDTGEVLQLANVISVLEDSGGNLWVGTSLDGFIRIDRNSGEFSRYYNGERAGDVDLDVTSILEDSNQDIYIGTLSFGLLKYNRAADRFDRITDPMQISGLFQDSGGTIWVATYLKGIHEFDPALNTFSLWDPGEDFRRTIRSFDAKSFYEDSLGNLWIGSDGNGLIKLLPNRERYFHYKYYPRISASISDDRVYAICEDDRGFIWVGTASGLNRLNPQNNDIKRFYEKDGLPDDVICGIMKDTSGNFWIGTYNGLSKFDPSSERFVNFDASDGLQENEFSIGCYSRSADGTFYFGGVNGINSFNPKELAINQHPPELVITQFDILDRTIDVTDLTSVEIPYGDNSFFVQFAALDFTEPSRNQYRYILEGHNNSWIENGNLNTARFSKLPPGDYTFKVAGSNSDGTWNETGVSLDISIIPPFWMTLQFRILVVVLIAVSIFTLYKIRMRNIKNQRSKLLVEVEERKIAEIKLITNQQRLREMTSELTLAEERERRKIAQALHDDIGHALASTKVKLLAQHKTSRDEKTKAIITNMIDSIEIALEKTRSLTSELSPPSLYQFGFESAVENLVERFGKEFNIKSVVTLAESSPISEDISVLLYQSLRELLMNVLKHAQAQAVNVTIDTDGEFLSVTVRDDGNGCDPEKVFSGETGSRKFGLFSIRERLEFIGGKLLLYSKKGEGTEVSMLAPRTTED